MIVSAKLKKISVKTAGNPSALTITPLAGGLGSVLAHLVITRLS